jgi:uncharacterized alpha-E superfamily protein
MRVGRALQSRVADNLFWLGCNAERLEWLLRLCRQALSRLEEDSGPEEDADTVIDALHIMIAKDTNAPLLEQGFGSDEEIERLVRTIIYGKERNNGVQATLSHLQRIAGQTRDRLSLDAWRTLNRFFVDRRWWHDQAVDSTRQMLDLLDQGLMTLAAFSGMAMENMTRSFGWRFLDMGRRIERADNMSTFLMELIERRDQVKGVSPCLMFLLEVADSFITYRSRYRIEPMLRAVIDLLLLDETNPRALAFQMSALADHITHLPKEPGDGQRSTENRLILDLLTQLQLADIDELSQLEPDEDGQTALQHLLRQYEERLAQLTDLLTRRYFTHTEEQARRI